MKNKMLILLLSSFICTSSLFSMDKNYHDKNLKSYIDQLPKDMVAPIKDGVILTSEKQICASGIILIRESISKFPVLKLQQMLRSKLQEELKWEYTHDFIQDLTLDALKKCEEYSVILCALPQDAEYAPLLLVKGLLEKRSQWLIIQELKARKRLLKFMNDCDEDMPFIDKVIGGIK